MTPFPDIADIHQPAPPPVPDYSWLWWAGAGLVTAALLVWLGWWLAVVLRRPGFPGLPARPAAAALRAIADLRARSEALPSERLGAELAGIVRTFLHRQTGIPANFSTSPEILGDAVPPDRPPPPPVVEKFRAVLAGCDAAKFNGHPLTAGEASRLLDAADAAVREASLARPPASAKPPPPLPANAISS